MGPDPAVAAVRRAVRESLADLEAGGLVLAACSGGADSLALAGALAFEAVRSGHRAGGITIDHGLQDGSAERGAEVMKILADLGLSPAEAIAVTVGTAGGPEAAAREARYAALDAAADRLGAAAIMLGHTRSDQAETVLLGLARGSGARSLAGMSPASGRYRRPLLGLGRATTERACHAMDLEPWADPHNDDPAYTRVRVRHQVLPAMAEALGPGVPEALARTARQLRDDADALDLWSERAFADAVDPAESKAGVALDIAVLEGLPRGVRTRVLRRAAIQAGCPPGALAVVHIDDMERLITAWRGQNNLDLPGCVRAWRRCGKLLIG